MSFKIKCLAVILSFVFCVSSQSGVIDTIGFNLSNIKNGLSHVKLDIGLSYSAPQSQTWLEKESNLLVFGFEPNPESVETIKKGNIVKHNKSHGDPLDKSHMDQGRFILFPFALADVEDVKSMDFYMTGNDCGTSSLYKPLDLHSKPIKNIVKVPVLSLKMFFDKFPWDRFEYIDYIKVDAQGADLDILRGAGKYLSERVVYVTAEGDGNQYAGADKCSATNIIKYMESQGFEFINHPNTNDPTFLNKKYKHLKDDIFIAQAA